MAKKLLFLIFFLFSSLLKEENKEAKEFYKEAMFYEKLSNKTVICELCFRKCVIKEGKRGFCKVRENQKGKLISLIYNRPSAIQIDPIEKEPLYHFLPKTDILCLGFAGCNFECRHCHNWHLSQVYPEDIQHIYLSPQDVVKLAKKYKVPTISFTYNDPIVAFEYMLDVAKEAKEEGINFVWHTNCAINKSALLKILKYTDAIVVDLKGFSDVAYANSSAKLEPVLENLKLIKQKGVWLEIVNLVIPTINDSPGQIREMCRWIRENLSADIPLHFSRFFPNYKLTHLPPTPIETLEKAYKIAKEESIKYVTIGNVPEHINNSTFCPNCKNILIKRIHFDVLQINIIEDRCKFCKLKIPGVWKRL